MALKSKSRTLKSKERASEGVSDISNRAVVVALVLVILVSMVSLGVYMKSLSMSIVEPEGISDASGSVKFAVVENPNLRGGQTSQAGGDVAFEVVKPE